MSAADRVFLEASAAAIARAGRARVRPKIRDGVGSGFGSRQLSNNVEIRATPILAGVATRKLYIDHYWALYVHDGRGPIPASKRKKAGGFFVWYKDRRQDPRLAGSGGYPRRATQVGRLSKAEFIRDKKAGKLIFAREVRAGVPPSPFFSNDPGGGMSGFMNTEVMPLMRARWRAHLDKRLKTIINITGTVTISLG